MKPLLKILFHSSLTASVLTGGALLCSSAQAQVLTNYLVNPGFESGIAGWTGYWNWAIESTNNSVYGSNPAKPVTVHGGSQAFKTWGGYTGGTTYCGAYQDIPAGADSTWALDGWGSTQSPDNLTPSGAAGNVCWLELSFRNSASPSTPLLTYTSNTLTTNTPPDVWTYLLVTDGNGETNLLAPGGTTFVRVQIVFQQPPGYPGGSAYLDDIRLLKTSAPDPEISVQPTNQTRVVSQAVTFSVTASGKTPLTYQWYKSGLPLSNGGRITGATAAALTISNLTLLDADYYNVSVTDVAGTLYSDWVYLEILDPGIITAPASRTLIEGQSTTLSVVAGGATPLTYQWLRSGTNLVNGGNISGVTTKDLQMSPLTPADGAPYSVTVTDAAGSTNAAVQVKVVPLAQLATNTLVNPGFEDGVDSLPWESAWVRFNGGDIQTTNDTYYQHPDDHVSVFAGQYVSRTWAGAEWNGIYQDRPARPGEIYTASAWFLTPAQDPISAANTCYLEVQFRTAGDAVLAQYSSFRIDVNFPLNQWLPLAPTNHYAGDFVTYLGTAAYMVAPPGTAKARCQITYHAQGGGGSVYYDNIDLRLRAPVVQAARQGQDIQLNFATLEAVPYQVYYKDDLTGGTWMPLGSPVMGNGSVKSVSYPATGQKRFYTVNTL